MIFYAIIQCIINIFACVLFTLDGYMDSNVITACELGVAIFFTLEIIGNCYIHPQPKLLYFTTIDFWMDACTVVPEFITLVIGSENMKSVGFLRILRVFKIMRIVKFRRTLKKVHLGRRNGELELQIDSLSRFSRQVIMLVVSLFMTLFIAAGVVIFVQDTIDDCMSEEMKFADSLYFVVVTVSTIGYGDILPIRSYSRIFVAWMLAVIFTIFGNQINKIIAVMRESDMYDVKYYLKQHIVIFNNKSISLLTNFVDFLFVKLNNANLKILIIDDVSWSNKMK